MTHSTRLRLRKGIAGLTALLVAVSAVVLDASPSGAAAPVLVNGGSPNQWLESSSVPKDTNGERIHVTAIVKHDLGTQVTGLAIDDDWNGTDSTGSIAPDAVTASLLPGGSSNYSAVRYSFVPPNQPGLSCGFFSGTRRVSNTLRMRAVLSDGQRTGVVAASVNAVENGQCTGVDDFPFLFNQSQSASQVAPGQSVTFTFQGDDADVSGTNDSFDKIRWRVRRLNDGAITQGPTNVGGLSDNTNVNLTVSFPSRGRYVVEAELGGEDDGFGDFANAGRFFRIGAVDVNSAASVTPDLALTPSSAVVDAGDTVTVTAAATDSDAGGRVQMLRWDADNNGSFERRELAADETTGLNETQREQTIATSAGNCADRTVRAEATDNGAMNGADSIRRAVTASTTIVVNCAPSANAQTRSTPEDTAAAITLSGADGDGDALTFTVVTPPTHGTITGGTGAARTYSPAANFHGSDSFTFRTTDAHGRQSSIATVTITVTAVNDAPVAHDATRSTPEDTPIAVDLSGAVSDVDGDALTVDVVGGPANGTAAAAGSHGITYTPDADFNGVDSFVYRVADGNGGTDDGVVTVTVGPVDDAPDVGDRSVTTPEDTAVAVVLGPTTDADGQAVTYAVAAPPANGSVVVAGNAATYTPAPDLNGLDSFVFTADDGTSTVMATVSVTVVPVNDAPVADDQSVDLQEDTATSIVLTGSDVDGDALAFTVTSGPLHGTLDTTNGPTVVYTPDPDYFGPDAFSFVVDDGQGGTDTATVSLDVTPVNDAPVAHDADLTTDEDTPVGVLLTATDVEGDALTFTITSGPTHGALSGTAPNLVYTPGLNHFGADSISFEVHDGNGGSDAATVSLAVAPVNDAPAAVPQGIATTEDTPVDITLSASDVDDTSLSFDVASGPTHGTLSGAAPDLVYTPDPDYAGDDGFTFAVTDPGGLTDTATVLITVGPVNDNPIAQDQVVTTDEDTGVLLVLAADDVDDDALAYAVEVAPGHGAVAVSGPNVVYSPAPNFHGSDQLVFRVEDGAGGVDFGTVDITVVPVNDAPDALPQVVTVAEDTATPVALAGTDVDGDALTFAVTSSPAHGTLSGTAPNLVYSPAADFVGSDSFTFSVTDPSGATDSATVTLDVQAAPMLATTLVADPAFVELVPLLGVRIGVMSATLTETVSGAPVVGAPLVFTTGNGQVLCTATTDANGYAECGDVAGAINLIANLGYNARFDGDADRLPASAPGPLVVVNGSRLL